MERKSCTLCNHKEVCWLRYHMFDVGKPDETQTMVAHTFCQHYVNDFYTRPS